MLKYWKSALVLFSLVLTVGVLSIGEHEHNSLCFPENDLVISSRMKSSKLAMTEEIFNKVIDEVESIYDPIIKNLGGQLEIERKWEDGTVNAYAQRSGNKYKVSMFGGLARHAAVTPDGFAMVVCHEVGHHLGGAPKRSSWWGSSWASNEGQADYWGSTKCMKRVLDVMPEYHQIDTSSKEYKYAEKECDKRFASQHDAYICTRSAMAGKSLANLFKDLRGLSNDLKFGDRDPKVVKKIFHSHPQPQCRLDTYFSGALCDKDVSDGVDDTDMKQGMCNRSEGYNLETRSLCWFKPEKEEEE